jgi:hypothetical protein
MPAATAPVAAPTAISTAASQILKTAQSARRGLGGEQPRPATRQIPLTERRIILYATRPKTLSPADPCNKVGTRGYIKDGKVA